MKEPRSNHDFIATGAQASQADAERRALNTTADPRFVAAAAMWIAGPTGSL